MGQFSKQLLNDFVPGIDDFCCAEIPNIALDYSEFTYWSGNFFLNRIFSEAFGEPHSSIILNLIYRAQNFFAFYMLARQQTEEFLAKRRPGAPGILRYLHALRSWESALINLQIFADLWRKFSGSPAFAKGDTSALQRAYDIANTIKHHSLPTNWQDANRFSVPMWLTDSGFSTARHSVTFGELATLGRELGNLADALQTPAAMRQALGKLKTDNVDDASAP